MADEITFDFKKALTFLSKNWSIIILVLIVAFGINLRLYHIGYPPIGYHNMKENQYLTEAKNMYDSGDYFRPRVFWNGMEEQPYIRDMLPIMAWSILLLWKIFGVKLVAARILMVFLSTLNIVLAYFLAKTLTRKDEIPLLAALLVAIIPISVFFGRNIQPDIPGVTFILLFSLFFFKWAETFSRKHFVLFTIFFTMAVQMKLTNAIGAFPLLFFFPYREFLKKIKRFIPEIIFFAALLLTVPLWKYIVYSIVPTSYTVYDSIAWGKIFDGFTPAYWHNYGFVMKSYIDDSFTFWYIFYALFGLGLCIFKYKNKFCLFCIASALSLIPYFMVLNDYMRRHSYYEAPFLIPIALLSAYFIYTVASLASQAVSSALKIKFRLLLIFLLISALLFVGLSYGDVKQSVQRQFDMQFYTNIAGEYINAHSTKDQRVYLGNDPSGQTYSVLWPAQRYGVSYSQNITEFKYGVENRNIRWIFLYGSALNQLKDSPEIWGYVEKNFHIAQIGVVTYQNQLVPYYFLLQYGGNFNLSEFEKKQPKKAFTYEQFNGNIELYTLEK